MNLGPADCFLEVQTREDAILARFTQPVSLCAELADATSDQLLSLLSDKDHKRLLVDFNNVESLTWTGALWEKAPSGSQQACRP
jgi:hypothetical protein